MSRQKRRDVEHQSAPQDASAADVDSGASLRSLYASDGGVRAIFSTKVADYVASRPDYPEALYAALRSICRIEAGARVVDVGAGTGLLTQGLLRCGWRVVAVEPNAAMREAADLFCGDHPGYQGVEGCAEAIPRADASADLIAAAQAFHWFDIPKARAECRRVLRPGAMVALIWNDRVRDDPLHRALDAVFAEFGGARREALLDHEDRRAVPEFFGAATPVKLSWPHEHRLDAAGLTALVSSRSYMPARDSPAGLAAGARVRDIFERFAVDGSVAVRYRTIAIIGAPGATPDAGR